MKQFILSLVLFVSFATAQDTVFVAPINSALIAVSQGGQINNISSTGISANQYTTFITGVQIGINDGTTEIRRWNVANYIFKVNGVVVSGASNILTAINALNAGVSEKVQSLKTIKVVSALPSPLEPNTEYVVGDTNLINITGLNGNDAKLWQVVINGVGTGTATSDLRLIMRINEITTVGAYGSTNTNTTQAGAVSYQNDNSYLIIGNFSVINTGANVHFSSNATLSPCVVGANTFRTMSANGSYARTSGVYGHTTSGGTFRDATSNITSLQITTSSPSATLFKVGTEIQILQLNK